MKLSQLHRCLGAPLCLLLLVISVSGTLLIWKPEYLWLSITEAREPVDKRPATLSRALSRIESHYPPDEFLFVQLNVHDFALHKVFLPNRQYAWHDQRGEQIQCWQGGERFEDWLLDLHHRLLLGNAVGLNMVGISGLLILFMISLGLYLWWPRRRLFRLGIWPRHKHRGAWVRSHSHVGVCVFLPLLLLSITGVILVYPSESRYLLLDSWGAHAVDHTEDALLLDDEWQTDQPWLSALQYSAARFPDSVVRWASLSYADNSTQPLLKIGLQQSTAWNRTGKSSLAFSQHTPRHVVIRDEFAQAKAKRLMTFTYPLHVAKLGVWYRVLLTISGIMISLLCVFAMMAFVKRWIVKEA